MKELFAVAIFMGAIVAFGILIGFPVKWLWNELCPYLFNLPEISFWQAVGVYLLCSILFKSTPASRSKD